MTKLNITFLMGNEVFNIFSSNNFFEESNIFQENGEKCFWGTTIFFRSHLKPRIHERTERFVNQMCICIDGTANLRCDISKWFAYRSQRTEICLFFARTQRELDVLGALSMHRVSFVRLRFAKINEPYAT